MDRFAYVYIMASRGNGTIYLASTSNLPRSVWEHRNGIVPGFTQRHGCVLLVWYEQHPDLASARYRERRMEGWPRPWKAEVIEAMNPDWCDLYEHIVDD